MEPKGFHRKLTAILSADVAGYSRLMGDDEAATVRDPRNVQADMSELIQQHRGRVVDSPGDNLLAEFASVVDAVQCAVAMQKELQARNAELPENRSMQFRIGVNLGDVIEEESRIYGDGVNIAARLESLADPGGICVSKTAFDQIETKLPFGYELPWGADGQEYCQAGGGLQSPHGTASDHHGGTGCNKPRGQERGEPGKSPSLVRQPCWSQSGPLPCGSSSSIKPHRRKTRLI